MPEFKYSKEYRSTDLPDGSYRLKSGLIVPAEYLRNAHTRYKVNYKNGTEDEYNQYIDKYPTELPEVIVTAPSNTEPVLKTEPLKVPGWYSNGIGINPVAARIAGGETMNFWNIFPQMIRHTFKNYEVSDYNNNLTREENALIRSRNAVEPNDFFHNSWDLGIAGKIKGFAGFGPTCTNTATSFYYPERPTAGTINLLKRPEQAGFKIIPQLEAVPGSLIVISKPDGSERHTVVYDQVYNGKPYINQYSDLVESGDTLVNYSNGSRGKNKYRLQRPLNKVFPERPTHTYFRPK